MTTAPMPEVLPRVTATELKESLELFEFAPKKRASVASLRKMLPDIATALFFAKVYKLDHYQLAALLLKLFNTSLLNALVGQGQSHSSDLQDYLVDTVPAHVLNGQTMRFDESAPAADTEVLGQLIEEMSVDIADSITKIADALGTMLDRLPSKYGEMTFAHLRKLNVQRNSLGKYTPSIVHSTSSKVLVIFDVSGSMSESTVRSICDEVVGMAYQANATMALVSDSCFVWEPGTYNTRVLLEAAQFGGTHYETLVPLLKQDWDVVITVADYDSSDSARRTIAQHATGRVGKVFDISLVNKPSFLAECVGQLASEVKPLITGNSYYPL